MNEARKYEIWRVEYKKDAYKDQTGQSQYGHVVYEQVIVTQTGSFPVLEHYSQKTYPDGGIIAETIDGRVFRGRKNLVDYWGGIMWSEAPETDARSSGALGYWQTAPGKPLSYCYPDGAGPVQYLSREKVEA